MVGNGDPQPPESEPQGWNRGASTEEEPVAMGTTITRQRVETPERWEKALQRALDGGVEIFRIAGTGEMVATSATKLDTVYRVDGHQCECEAALAGDPICTHRAAARFILGWLTGQAAPVVEPCRHCQGRGSTFREYCGERRPCD